MLIHLIIATALIAPGATLNAAAAPSAAMVCRVAASARAVASVARAEGRHVCDRNAFVARFALDQEPQTPSIVLTTQLRQ